MFYALGSIFTPKNRHAENTDTRQGIQRHDPEFERNRGGQEAMPEEEADQEGATISVEALRIFLENFIRDQETNKTPDQSTKNNIEGDKAPPPKAPQTYDQKRPTTHAAKAASAYQTMSQANDRSKVLLETTDSADGPALDLGAADIRVIHALIADLKILNGANIEFLHIERAASFLESLVNAVDQVKTQINQ